MFRRAWENAALIGLTGFYWLFGWLWRVQGRALPRPPGDTTRRVYAHWHTDELLLIHCYAGRGVGVMASRSRDGERLNIVLRLLGYRLARGSSSRGGVGGLKGLIDFVRREGADTSLAVDGPRGPIFRVKPGVVKLAQQTGAQIVPLAASAARRFVFKKAWNQCYLPLPFSSCVVLYGTPFTVPPGISDGEFEQYRLRLEREMIALKAEAERRFAWTPHPMLGAIETAGA